MLSSSQMFRVFRSLLTHKICARSILSMHFNDLTLPHRHSSITSCKFKLFPAIQCPYCMYIYQCHKTQAPSSIQTSKRPLGWSLFEEYADANVVEDARDFLHNTSLMGETIKVERRHQKWRDCVFLYLNMCNCVTKNPSMWRLLYMYYVLKASDLKNAERLFTGRVANARTAYYFVAGSMLPAFMGRYNRPSTIVWTPISIQKMMSFRLQHAQMSDWFLMPVTTKRVHFSFLAGAKLSKMILALVTSIWESGLSEIFPKEKNHGRYINTDIYIYRYLCLLYYIICLYLYIFWNRDM